MFQGRGVATLVASDGPHVGAGGLGPRGLGRDRGDGGEGATIAGIANPNGSETIGYFRVGTEDPGTCDESFGTRLSTTGGATLGNGTCPRATSRC